MDDLPEAKVCVTGSEVPSILIDGGGNFPPFIYGTGSGLPEAEVGVTGSEVPSILVDGGNFPPFIYGTGSGLPEVGWTKSFALTP